MDRKIIPTAWTFITDENRVLLYLRKNTWYENENYGLPGGIVDTGETATVAAVREVYEETGLKIVDSTLELLEVITNDHEDSAYVNNYFKAQNWSGIPENKEPDRCGDLSWFPVDQLPENIIADVQRIIAEKL